MGTGRESERQRKLEMRGTQVEVEVRMPKYGYG